MGNRQRILISELKPGFHIFGNHGAVCNRECHIAKDGCNPDTLCGTPMLSTNWAKLDKIEVIGCQTCINLYKEMK